ncbi:uncharacterized protein [Rutidosis leptorrhynchoides]|uniref:uncharacterized protein n=1 Tax=Rutidosis leptorrhynchoides TaxID=125765 RepID=UPI003A99C0F3
MNVLSLNIRGFGGSCKIRWFKRLCREINSVIVHLQESKCGDSSDAWLELLWGTPDFKFIQKNSVGSAGGMITLWDTNVFEVTAAAEGEYYLAIKGKWKGKQEEMVFVNIYGPHTCAKKVQMWESLDNLISSSDIPLMICRDFSKVRFEDERFNCIFKKTCADKFNSFINTNCLFDLHLSGKKYIRYSDNGVKFAKLDRFLISEKFNHLWLGLNATILDHNLSDHCPIVLRDKIVDFRPKPVKVFNLWLNLPGAEGVICEAWNTNFTGNHPNRIFHNKLKCVKLELKNLNASINGKLDEELKVLAESINSWEKAATHGNLMMMND